MCGIFALLNFKTHHSTFFYEFEESFMFVRDEFNKGIRRGPENSKITEVCPNTIFGFHRLAINGMDKLSNQPLRHSDCILICNGEIYNYKYLYELINVEPRTNSDCEIIIHLYRKFGIEHTLLKLDGVFAFLLLDLKTMTLYSARDSLGIRPLYIYDDAQNNVGFASEAKCLTNLFPLLNTNYKVKDAMTYSNISAYTPGHYSVYDYNNYNENWILKKRECFYQIGFSSFPYEQLTLKEIYNTISSQLKRSVYKRCETTDRPFACLLSGGLDSSLITGLVNLYNKENNVTVPLETFSIGLDDASDLKYAKEVADYLETNHTEIKMTEKEMFDIIPEVIYAVETYDTTTIRASIGNYLIGKYISKHSEAKVVFNGDGSDELFGGYLYMKKCPDACEFDKETRRLLKNISFFDVLRSDKCISSNGLEPRTPFLDKAFVNFVASIPDNIKFEHQEKQLLRNSFSSDYFKTFQNKELIPDCALWRRKEAFSDGVSHNNKSLYNIIQERICEFYKQKYFLHKSVTNIPPNIETEKMYYKNMFDNYFPNCDKLIPNYWMPKYVNNTSDPSARTLDIYKL